jgi:2-polyprenyl-6-methoxyphenol hydroxylase-like FAD-dependent oxidoreductase
MSEPVVIVGGGPGGMMLGYLLGRAGIPATVIEAAADFDRDFRGDSLHPYTLELFRELGLAEKLLALPHEPARFFRFHTAAGTITTADYGQLDSPYPFIALMPQARFLDFLATEVAGLPGCSVRTGSKVTGLARAGDRVTGVRIGDETVAARLVVGTDGRFSRLRRLADLPVTSLGAATDLLWFRLPRHDTDPADADLDLFFGRDHYAGVLTGTQGWQIGYTVPKGGFNAARDAGVEPIRRFVAEHIPWLADRVHLLTGFDQITLLSVAISRAERWWRPGVLLLGDAAHVISPVGGNGILMAIQDAVAAANHLTAAGPGPIPDQTLAAIQADREPAIKTVQAQQVRVEQRAAKARASGRSISPPSFLRLITALPGVRRRSAFANAYGPNPPRLSPPLPLSPSPH